MRGEGGRVHTHQLIVYQLERIHCSHSIYHGFGLILGSEVKGSGHNGSKVSDANSVTALYWHSLDGATIYC